MFASLFVRLRHAAAAGLQWLRALPLWPWLQTTVWPRLRHPRRRDLQRLALAIPLLGLLYVLVLIPFTPSISDIRKAKLEQPAHILTADGKLLAEFKRSNRSWVGLDEVAPAVVEALIATEDHRFYQHHGLDWRRTASSLVLTLQGDPQGGSTLTQQLARNLYPNEIGRSRSLNRKLKEAITAFKIEALYTKAEILETYLNTVPFLYNAYGIEMAARTYFDKSAKQLNVLEAATLVGMLKGTSYYNPVLNPERALARRNTVLSQMRKREVLADAEFERLKTRPLRIDFARQEEPTGPAPHFAQQLRKWLIAWADSQDYNIYADGLVVHTTIDSRMQAWANQAVARQGRILQSVADSAWNTRDGWQPGNPLVQALVRETAAYRKAVQDGQAPEQALKALLADKAFMRQLRQDKLRIQAGFVAMDPRTSAVLAWVGSRGFADDAYDHVLQARRQPGSTFKPFVYGAALQQGLSPDDTRVDQAVEIALPGGEIWRPSDAGPPTGQAMALRDALAYSKNTITATLVQEVGPAKVARLARALGVRQSPLEAVPALALGSSPVSLHEMVNAYASIADGGAWRAPQWVTRITNREGEVLAEFPPAAPEQVLDADTSYALVDMLRGVVDKGTARAIRSQWGIRADVAGKTGTTQGNADGWFILMHPQLVVGAWAGFNDARITLRSDRWGQGARSALPMVGDFTSRVLRSSPLVEAQARFEPPEDHRWWRSLWRSAQGQVQRWWQAWWPTPAPKPKAAPAAPPAAPAPLPEPTPAEPPLEEVLEIMPAAPVAPAAPVPPTPVVPVPPPSADGDIVSYPLPPMAPLSP